MSIRTFVLLIFFLFAGVVVFIAAACWNRQAIVLSGGGIIPVEKTWILFDEVYYEDRSGALETVKTRQVERIARAGITGPEDWEIILKQEMALRKVNFSLPGQSGLWLIFAAGSIFLVLVIFMREKHRPRQGSEKLKDRDPENFRAIHISPDLPDFNKVLLYFLNLYLLQMRAKAEDRYTYQPLDINGPLGTTVYAFKIQRQGHGHTRKLSIGPIGETSGARSKCYYCVFDDHFVVKIPPVPVGDFAEYLTSIGSDRRIAHALSPRECLVPRLAIILKKIPAFSDALDKVQGDDESKCLEILKLRPEFKEFLKIGGSYAFFMDLSRHFFLGHILKDCHETAGAALNEIKKHPELIWLPEAFADRYGDRAGNLSIRLQNLFNRFDEQLKDPSVAQYRKKSWFIAMIGAVIDGSRVQTSPGHLTPAVQAAFAAAKISDNGALNAYAALVRDFAESQVFRQNRTRIGSICARLVELLAWLDVNNVAVRDLKPDNLLVVGDPAKYPQFLSTPREFELGLIDVELAVCMGSENGNYRSQGKFGFRPEFEQPRLGWTPFYATPSHMLVNEVLADLYGDVADMLKLQDWYAVAAMIYQSVTGKKLFDKTAALISSMGRDLPRYLADQKDLKKFARKTTPEFWQCAADEVEQKLETHKKHLEAVHVELFKNVRKMFAISSEASGSERIKNQMRAMPPAMAAGDLIRLMFDHVRERMQIH